MQTCLTSHNFLNSPLTMLIGHDAMPAYTHLCCSYLSRGPLGSVVHFPQQPWSCASYVLPDLVLPRDGIAHHGRLDLAEKRHPQANRLELSAASGCFSGRSAHIAQGVPRKILECGLLESTANRTYVRSIPKKHRPA